MSKGEGYARLRKRIETYVDKFPLPSKEVNHENFRRLRELQKMPGRRKEYEVLRARLVLSNGGFGMKYAIKYCKKINDDNIIEDIFQQAQMGIIEAVDRFDPYRGVNFTTFAFHYVRKCIIDFIKLNKLVIAPRDMARNMRHVSEVQDDLYSLNFGRQISNEEIKIELRRKKSIDLNESMIGAIVRLLELNSASPDETFISGGVEDLPDQHGNHETLTLMKSMILNEIRELDQEELEVIKLRFGIDVERPYSIPEIKMLREMSNRDIEKVKEHTRIFLNNRR